MENCTLHIAHRTLSLIPGLRRGRVTVPPSKSHGHRLLIANYLAGERGFLEPAEGDNADILATKRCLKALDEPDDRPVLDCGESGSTLRFIAPIAAAMGKRPDFVRHGRLGERPFMEYDKLIPGVFELAGDISSQFTTGLLFALPLLRGDSEIHFTSPLESKGYVDMTLDTLEKAGIEILRIPQGFRIPGGQKFHMQPYDVEGDWSGAAFWYGMNALGSDIAIKGLNPESAQPDRVICELLDSAKKIIDVSQSPDLFPVLAVVAAGREGRTVFTGISRLRLKECDRVEAMRNVLSGFGARVEVESNCFAVTGTSCVFRGGKFITCGDHRVAMAIAVGATRSSSPVEIDNADCESKSYPGFFAVFNSLEPVAAQRG